MNDAVAAPIEEPTTPQPERPDTSSGWVPQAERRLLRALIDIPDFAARVVPALDPELFEYPASEALYTFVAEDFHQHHAAPDFHTLHLRNDSSSGHNERSVKVVAALIRDLEQMAPIPATQLPILLKDADEWIRERKVETRLRRIVGAWKDIGTDKLPLIDQLKAAYEWRLDETVSGRYVFKTHDALLHSTCAPFLVRNMLVQNSLVALVSPPNCNKTFLALDLALSVASGQSTWLGEPLHLSGPVVYVLGEGGGRFKLRVQAWDEQHEITQTYPFHYVNEPVALTNRADASAFVREVAALKPVLVVFDTLSRCLAGADENNQKDMSAAVGVCDTLRQQLGCTVLLLHHTTKDGATERGSSVLRGAVDTLLVLKVPDPSDPHFTMTCEKQKDVESFAPIALLREPVTLVSERDPDTGDPVMSCVVKVATGAQVSQRDNRRLWNAKQFVFKNPQCSKTELAKHIGGRNTETLREIDEWVSQGELRFQPKRQRSPLVSLKAEQVVVPAA